MPFCFFRQFYCDKYKLMKYNMNRQKTHRQIRTLVCSAKLNNQVYEVLNQAYKDLDMDKELLGKCGYYCGQCPGYTSGKCKGCLKGNAQGVCFARDCAIQKGILSCGCCLDFPCPVILNNPKASLLSPLWLKWRASQKDV